MNTSRDIEKLFDHFGGNAGDYQEIGRENEAKTARTRWPLLATLDFAQPAIPEIAPRRDSPVSAAPSREPLSPDTTGERASPTPINRGKPPLFARAHRRTIPPVTPPVAVDSLSSARFSALADAVPLVEETVVIASAAQAAPLAHRTTFTEPVKTEPARSGFLASQAPKAPVEEPAAAPSILGKLFAPKPPEPAAAEHASDGSLTAMFNRLRQANEPKADAPGRATLAARLTRS